MERAARVAESRERRSSPGRGSELALYEMICPAIYVIRAFGLAPYEFAKDPRTRRPRLRASRFNCLYTIFWAVVYSYVVFKSLAQFNGLDSDKPVLGVTETTKVGGRSTGWICSMIYGSGDCDPTWVELRGNVSTKRQVTILSCVDILSSRGTRGGGRQKTLMNENY